MECHDEGLNYSDDKENEEVRIIHNTELNGEFKG